MKYTATLCGKVIGPSGQVLKPITKKNGYHTFSQSLGYGKQNQTSIHRFVYEFFHGPIPEGLVIDHINGDKADNRLHNLEAVTQKENVARGAAQKLTTGDVANIRSLLGTTTQRAIAKQFGVSEQTICDIKKGRKHNG